MNNFKGGGGGGFKKGGSKSRFDGKKSFGGGKKFSGGQNRGDRTSGPAAQLFSATCSECRSKCDVPFKPSNDKPVYCSACFGAKKGGNESRSADTGGERGGKGSYNNDRPDYTKLPREERPARHNAERGRGGNDSILELKQQITGLELKLNRILELINPPMPSKKVPLEVQEKKVSKKVATKVAPKKATAKASTKVATKVVPKKVATKTLAKKATVKTTKKTAPKKAAAKASVKKVAKKVVAKQTIKKAKK